MNDNEGRKINYLRISVTDRCNLRCIYCMPEKGIKKREHNHILSLEEIENIVKVGVDLGINKVRITGGEPLVRKGIISLIDKLANIKGINDLAMTTNGLLLKDYAYKLKSAGLNRINISIDTLNHKKYHDITRGGDLEKVLEGINIAKEVGLNPIKLNVVLIGGFNDNEIEDFIKFTCYDKIDVRFIELMPIGEASRWSMEHFISNEVILERFPQLIEVNNEDKASPAKYYRLPHSKGKVGLINPISSHFCNDCNRIRITADGRIKPCLHSNTEIDIKRLLKENISLEDIIIKAIKEKPHKHNIETLKNYEPIVRNMYQIGG